MNVNYEHVAQLCDVAQRAVKEMRAKGCDERLIRKLQNKITSAQFMLDTVRRSGEWAYPKMKIKNFRNNRMSLIIDDRVGCKISVEETAKGPQVEFHRVLFFNHDDYEQALGLALTAYSVSKDIKQNGNQSQDDLTMDED